MSGPATCAKRRDIILRRSMVRTTSLTLVSLGALGTLTRSNYPIVGKPLISPLLTRGSRTCATGLAPPVVLREYVSNAMKGDLSMELKGTRNAKHSDPEPPADDDPDVHVAGPIARES